MKKYLTIHSVVKMSKVLDVSESGYYDWLNREPSQTKRIHNRLHEAIKNQFEKHGGMAGSWTISKDLQEVPDWKNISRTRVAREMKAMELRCKTKRRFTVTTNSNHKEPVAKNLLSRNFTQPYPNKAWVTDITYLRVKSHWVYLVMFIDLYSRKVVGWDLSKSLAATSTLKAFKKAVWSRKPEKGLMVHSDPGIQYACKEFRKAIKEYKFIQSMSRKGNCWDNAVAESFFSTLKTRLTHHRKYESIKELRRDLFWYIEIYYNRYRKHSANDWVSPEQKELNFNLKQQNCA